MKPNKILSLLLALLLFSALGCQASAPASSSLPSACVSAETPSASASAAVSFTDMTGRKISLAEPAKRIVALTASDCEILFAIGAGDTLVGRGAYCDYPEAVSFAAQVQSGSETNIEQIIALKPQVVVMNKMAQSKEQIKALEQANIAVVVNDANTIEEVYTSIALMGTLTGKASEAQAVIDQMKASFAAVAAQAPGEQTQSIYFEVSPLEHGLWTAGANTFMDEIAAMLGYTNAFADVSGWAEISQEQVLERNPDYIVTITMYYGEGPTPEQEIASRAGWQNVSAVKNAKIYHADLDEISRPGPRLCDAAKSLYAYLWGKTLAS